MIRVVLRLGIQEWRSTSTSQGIRVLYI